MDDRLPISVLLLARDEARELASLLPELAFAREVVVVWDPRGDEAVRALAERSGARVFARALHGFGAQRAFALAQCTQDWVLWLDADERLTPGSVETLARVTRTAPPGVTHLLARRTTWFLGRRIRWCGWNDEWLPRLFHRGAARFDDALVHERVHVEGRAAGASGPFEIEHRSYESWEDCVRKMVHYSEANAEQAWRGGTRATPLDVLARPPLRFLRQYVLQLGFLDGAHGLVLCGFAAVQVFLKYSRLWGRGRAGGPP